MSVNSKNAVIVSKLRRIVIINIIVEVDRWSQPPQASKFTTHLTPARRIPEFVVIN
jgi:hypothetical protein